MKILFDHQLPFLLAHGGFSLQIEQTKLALAQLGVDVEYLRWWDSTQPPDIIHYFGRVDSDYVRLARARGIRVVLSELRTAAGSRPPAVLATQRFVTGLGRRFLPEATVARLGWDVYAQVDAAIALTEWEGRIMREISGCPSDRLHIIPNGVEDVFFDTTPAPPLDWLICTATIHPRKRVLELAHAAAAAQTPVWIIGKPYDEREPYHRAFLDFAHSNPQWVRYEGAIDDRSRLAEICRGARGFVLVSAMESQSLSALEAAAARCPLLLSDLLWARTTFGGHATYCPNAADTATLARHLRAFWEAGRSAAPAFVPLRWTEVAERLRQLYETLCSTSR